MKTHLTPRELAQATAVSESSIKRWIEGGRLTASKTAGGHRRIPLTTALQFIRRAQLPVTQPGLLGLTEAAADDGAGTVVAGDMAQALTDALLGGDADEARSLLMSLFMRGRTIAEICDGPVVSAMQSIGEIWQHDADGIFIEHRATTICTRLMQEMKTLLGGAEASAPMAVGAAGPGDPYRLPSLIVSATLASIGWREVDLGADLPLDSLRRAAEAHEAKLVWLSISSTKSAGAIQRDITDLACDLGELGVALVVGGRVLPAMPVDALGNLHVANSMGELAAFARALQMNN